MTIILQECAFCLLLIAPHNQINNLCRAALLLGVTENKQILDETDLKRVILDLDGQSG